MKKHIRLLFIAIFFSFSVVAFAHTKEEVDREIRRGGDLWQKEMREQLKKQPFYGVDGPSTLFEDGYTDPCNSRMFMNGTYCNDYFDMQNKLRAWRRKWLLEGPEEFCALGMKGVKVWHYNKKERASLIKKYGGGARPNFLYGVKYIGEWTEKDQRKLNKQIYAQENIYLRQLKIEERRAKRQVEQWPIEWEQKEKEFLDSFKEKEYREWLDERKEELSRLMPPYSFAVSPPFFTVETATYRTPFQQERRNFLHIKLKGTPYVPPEYEIRSYIATRQ